LAEKKSRVAGSDQREDPERLIKDLNDCNNSFGVNSSGSSLRSSPATRGRFSTK